MTQRRLLAPLFFLLLLMLPSRSFGFVPQIEFNERGRIVSVSWSASEARSGLQYFVNTNSFPFSSRDIDRIIANSHQAWDDVVTADLQFVNGGSGNFRKSSTDGQNVITYDPSGTEIGAPAGSGVIAITTINWDEQGRVTDADITFNGRDFSFSVSEAFPGPGPVDLQDVMTHEIGHVIGLDHTPLVGPTNIRPTMNPFASQDAPGVARTLEPDDAAGATALYPSPEATQLGSITGQVMDRNGNAAFGVHVVAYDAVTGDFVVSALSGAAGDNKGRDGDGRYLISGLPPGAYRVGIEPIQGSVSEQNVGGIFSGLKTGFSDEFYDNVDRLSIAQSIPVEAGRVFGPIDFVLGLTVPGFPQMTNLQLPVNTPDTNGPYGVRLSISDEGTVVDAVLRYQVNGSGFFEVRMVNEAGTIWHADIPGTSAGARVEYQIVATDDDGNVTAFPPNEDNPLTFDVIALTGNPVIYVVMSGSSILSALDSGNGREVARIETGDTPHDAVMTPDEKILFVANTGFGSQTSRTVTAIETSTHKTLATINVGFGPLDMAVTRAGDKVYVANSDARSLSVIDTEQLREMTRISLPGMIEGPFGVAISPDGQTVYATDIEANQVFVVDANVGSITDRIDVVGSPRSVTVSPDGTTLYVSGFEGGISVVSVSEGREVERISTTSGVFRVKLSPDGKTLYATSQDAGELLAIDTGQLRISRTVRVLPAGSNTRGLTVSEDGGRIYVTNSNSNDLVVYNASSLTIEASYKLGDGPRAILVRSRIFESELPVAVIALSDFDADGIVGFNDFLLFAAAFGTESQDSSFDARFDLDGSGIIDFPDFLAFAKAFGRSSLN
jgi:YVTN family beta-propeller protein